MSANERDQFGIDPKIIRTQREKIALTEENKEALLRDLFDLIAIDTSNPPGKELQAAELVRSKMASLGANCILQKFAPQRANAICHIPFSQPEDGPCLIFNSHLDVVPSGEGAWTYPPFKPTIIGGRVYGRGACDAKGSLAAMMAAVRLALQAPQNLQGELILTAVAAEETGGLGTQFWLKSRREDLRPSMAIVGEPSGLKPVIAHKGVSRRKLSVRGRSAHSSDPSQGRNAIYPVARLAIFIEELNEKLARRTHPLLGLPLVSANVIRGGVKDNVIPDYCELHMDRRRIPGETRDQFDRELNEWVENMVAMDPSFRCQIEVIGDDKEPVVISPEEPIVRAAVEAIHEVTGQRETPQGFVAATDMSFLVHQGNIPSIILGPGNLAQTHIVDEFVEISHLEQATLIYAYLITRLLGPKRLSG
ncbi:MAG: M20 family metallopeptidase [Deltaproteobacteria bacterium]|nr:M20 family metallopeptidase [Deltaproteobacteria bacterium]